MVTDPLGSITSGLGEAMSDPIQSLRSPQREYVHAWRWHELLRCASFADTYGCAASNDRIPASSDMTFLQGFFR